MKIELCDLCENKEANKRFKVKKSTKGMALYNRKGWMTWEPNIWQPYEKISICEDCAEKLLGIMSQKTRIKKIAENKVY